MGAERGSDERAFSSWVSTFAASSVLALIVAASVGQTRQRPLSLHRLLGRLVLETPRCGRERGSCECGLGKPVAQAVLLLFSARRGWWCAAGSSILFPVFVSGAAYTGTALKPAGTLVTVPLCSKASGRHLAVGPMPAGQLACGSQSFLGGVMSCPTTRHDRPTQRHEQH